MNNEIKGGVSAILNTDKVVYTGGDTGSAVVSVDNYDRVIYADVNDEILDKVYTRIPDNKLNKYLMPLPYETDGNKIKIWYNVDEQGWNQFEGLKCGDCYYFFHEDTKTLYFWGNGSIKTLGATVDSRGIKKNNSPWASCDAERIILSRGISEIGMYAFCNMKSVREVCLPDDLLKINKGVFEGCNNLDHIIIPKNVGSIDENTFNKCDNLMTIYLEDGHVISEDKNKWGSPHALISSIQRNENLLSDTYTSESLVIHKGILYKVLKAFRYVSYKNAYYESSMADIQDAIDRINREIDYEINPELNYLGSGLSSVRERVTALEDSIPEELEKVKREVKEEIEPKLDQVKKDVEESIKPSLLELEKNKISALWYDEFTQVEGADKQYWYALDNLNYVDSEYEEAKEHFILDSEGNPIPYDFGKGGGGGGGGDTVVKVTAIDWPISIALGNECIIKINWSSTKEEVPTGSGDITVAVNNKVVITKIGAPQGLLSFDITKYLSSGSNKITVTATDAYDTKGKLVGGIEAVALSLSSNFNSNLILSGNINYTYIPVGNIKKTVHFLVDGREVGQDIVLSSNEQQTHIFSGWTHGHHILQVYFTCEIEGNEISSNELYYDLIFDGGLDTPIIASTFRELEQTQYNQFTIPYRVYTPNRTLSDVQLLVGNVLISSLQVNQDIQYWSYNSAESGQFDFRIKTGDVERVFHIDIKESELIIEPVKQNLALYLGTVGRSNSEPESRRVKWEDQEHGISAVLSNFNFASDGWIQDKDNNTILRVTGNARVSIPYKPFENDFKSTGKTIELELATSEVRDYDATILSCFSGNRGFYVTPQLALMKSQQSELKTQYKEDDHVRLAFVVEKDVETHLILMYINGIMSGAVQYPSNDEFRQLEPMDITIGSNDATVDIYNIRIYDNNLNRKQIVNNWIADTQVAELKYERYYHNDNYNESGEIVVDKLPSDLPYMIYAIPELPTYKGDKRTADLIKFVDPNLPDQNYTATGAQMNVQGTSSQYYFRKNFKINHKGGFTMSDGVVKKKYPIRPEAIEEKEFTYKADVASSESANNTELVKYYQDTKHWKSPAEKLDDRIRVGIDGFPYVAFHNDGEKQYFYGKMNFNNDKGNKDTYGFATNYDDNGRYIDGDESWEMTNNNTDLDLFKSDDLLSVDHWDDVEKRNVLKWETAFESRFPDDNTPDEHVFGRNPGEIDRLRSMVSWVYSTYRKPGDSEEVKERKLAKFKAELANYFDVKSTLYYYLFTELFLMVDSRAKNAFPTYMKSRVPGDGGDRWFWYPYDMDTAIGTNNEGLLVFDYNLEDTDKVDGAYVYNGQESVMWNNVRDAYSAELTELYADLRSGNAGGKEAWNYEGIEKRYEDHQNKWSESIFNEDAYSKYLIPLIQSQDATYLGMLQGSKAEQRKWWLNNRFKYLDSKYQTGNALASTIMMRAYQKSDFNIIPYSNIYIAANFDDQIVSMRAEKDKTYLLKSPESWDPAGTDAVVGVRSADQLKDLGDLSKFYVGYADFHQATKLQRLIVGSADPDYRNEKLTEINVGNNKMLKLLDVRNCVNLKQAVNLSGCANIEEAYFDGTQVGGVELPNGGYLRKLHLPNTITSLEIRNHPSLEELVIEEGLEEKFIERLWLEKVPSEVIDAKDIIKNRTKEGAAVRLIGFNMDVENSAEIKEFYDLLDTMKGINAQGQSVNKAQVNGTINLNNIAYRDYIELIERYPDVKINAGKIMCLVKFINEEKIYDAKFVEQGSECPTPEKDPTKKSTLKYYYVFIGWYEEDDTPADLSKIMSDKEVYAHYEEREQEYIIHFDPQSDLAYDLPEDQIKKYQELVEVPTDSEGPIPRIKGATLIGWYTEKECINLYDFDLGVDHSFTLYAKWQDEEDPIVVDILRKAYNKFEFVISDNIAVTHYAITTTEELPTDWIAIEDPKSTYHGSYEIDSAGTYYVWGKDSAELYSNKIIKAFVIETDSGIGTEIKISEDDILLDSFALQGTEALVHVDLDSHYENLDIKFNGESIDNDSIITISEDSLIESLSEPKTYTVHFDLGGKGTPIDPEDYVYNSLIIKPQNQYDLDSGSITNGWFLEPELINEWNFESDRIDRDLTLYVKWDDYKEPTYLSLDIKDESDIDVSLYLRQTVSEGTLIDFGDGSSTLIKGTGIVNTTHTYAKPGSYVISITRQEGEYLLGSGNITNRAINPISILEDIEFAYDTFSTEDYAFYDATNLSRIILTNYMTKIAKSAFQGCSGVSELYLSDNISIIDDNAFNGCNQISGQVKLPQSLVKVGNGVFRGCSSVEEFILPTLLSEIGEYTFAECSGLKSINIPESLEILNERLFSGCTSLEEIIIPENIKYIGSNVYSGCSNLIKVTILNKDVKTLEATNRGSIFSQCEKLITAGPIGSDCTIEFAFEEEIPDYFFSGGTSGTYLSNIILPDTIRRIGINAFTGCDDIHTINLPKYLEEIGDRAFLNCWNLEGISIPMSCIKIGKQAFGQCIAFRQVYLHNPNVEYYKVDEIGEGWLSEAAIGAVYHIPSQISSLELSESLYGKYWYYINSAEKLIWGSTIINDIIENNGENN